METTGIDNPRDRRSLAGLFSDLWRDTSVLVQDEVELARVEMAEKVSQVGSGIATIAVAGAILFAGFLLLLLAAVAVLALVLPPDHAAWLSPLIVGGVIVAIGLAALASGRKDLKTDRLRPSRTMTSLRRDRDLVKEHFK